MEVDIDVDVDVWMSTLHVMRTTCVLAWRELWLLMLQVDDVADVVNVVNFVYAVDVVSVVDVVDVANGVDVVYPVHVNAVAPCTIKTKMTN